MQILQSAVQRLLVKLPADVQVAPMFRAGSVVGSVFRSIAALAEDAGTFVGSGLGHPPTNYQWHAMTPMAGARGLHPWDAAHELARRTSAATGQAPIYAEPDYMQQSVIPQRSFTAETLAAAVCSSAGYNGDWGPTDQLEFGWHLDNAYSGLKTARDTVGNRVGANGKRVRIAHLDTGFDPNHVSRPMNLHTEMAWNFVDNNNSAVAPAHASGLFADPSHGTGTLGLLAGNRISQLKNDFLGGAPYADIVPVRIGNTWLHLQTSALAGGIAHAVGWSCDIISMSAGGIPAQSWADAVNHAYESGCCIFAASGDSVGGLPTHLTIYPARFNRVVSVCGVTHGNDPYYRNDFFLSSKLEGSWGPDSAMHTAIAAYAPNVPWAKLGCPEIFDNDGGGTSAATPQAAAAGALWLQLHLDELTTAAPWQKVEAIRRALFTSAVPGDLTHLGNGMLRAAEALKVGVDLASLKMTPPDNIDFALFKELFALPNAQMAANFVAGSPSTDPRLHMLEVEAAQLVLSSPQLAKIVGDADIAQDPLVNARKELIDAMRASPAASQTLRAFLDGVSGKF